MTRKNGITILAALVFLSAFGVNVSFACSNFQVRAEDGSIVIGRSVEFPVDLHSNIVIVPRGEQFVSVDDKGVKGIAWLSRTWQI